MEFAAFLLKLLAGGTTLAATRPEGFAGAALEALTARLEGAHDVETLSLLPRAAQDPGVRQAILSELVDPAIAEDSAVCVQAEVLRAEIESLPEAEIALSGLTPDVLRAGREIIARAIEAAIGRSWTRGAEGAGEEA